MGTAKYEIRRECQVCGATFLAKTLDSRYCSRKCSNHAFNLRRKEKERLAKLDEIAASVPDIREYISVTEAVAIFGLSKDTIRRLIRSGKIHAVNIGQRLTRINKKDMEAMYPVRTDPVDKTIALPKPYYLEPENCYTVGEIHDKFGISESTIFKAIRDHAIPTRQIGKFVYVPKQDIDNLFK